MDYSAFLETAKVAAHQAGAHQLAGLHAPKLVREQRLHDVKLQIDVECEAIIRASLRQAYPEYALLGEEEGGEIAKDQPTWVIDPLDGTVNYSRQLPHFCCSIGLLHHGESQLGVVYDPLLNEMFTAIQGGGAFLNGTPIHVSEIANLATAIITTGFASQDSDINHGTTALGQLARGAYKVRLLGAAALDLAYVAAGRLDGFIEHGIRLWDIAAGRLLVTEAGGRIHEKSLPDGRWRMQADNGRIW